jgi:hypothetical protein
MKRKLLILVACFLFVTVSSTASNTIRLDEKNTTSATITVFNEIVFYAGYAAYVSTPAPPQGVLRLKNSLNARKLTDFEISQFDTNVTMNVTVKAACDNYDRIGNISLALVPKNSTTYNPLDVQHIEIGRFITPFMNKNYFPNQVPYSFDVSNLTRILQDTNLSSVYDFWIEFELFGVASSAQQQVAGCSGRIDVFYGSLSFVTNAGVSTSTGYNYLLPIAFKEKFNNYQTGASDVLGQTIKTVNINLPTTITNAKLYLITSNHGANSGGEEYNRRFHYVTFDNASVLTYKPGSTSCEPFRMYNTQANGIYGSTPKSDAVWQSFSNWCPGDKIPIRVISLGSLSTGAHTFVISVPDAQFVGQQGNFPFSLYLQGDSATALSNEQFEANSFAMYPNPATDEVLIESNENIKEVLVYDVLGQQVLKTNSDNFSVSELQSGVYVVKAIFENNTSITQKLIRK